MPVNSGIPIVPCCSEGGGGNLLPLLLVLFVMLGGYVVFQEFKKRKGTPGMKNLKNLAIVVAVLVAVGIAFALKQDRGPSAEAVQPTMEATVNAVVDIAPVALPRLLDLGADKCIPCKMMVPILDDLKTTYAGRMQVEFIDVWKNPDAGTPYDIRVIPTQILFDSEGNELFRHEGFFAKEDILAKWKELGFEFK